MRQQARSRQFGGRNNQPVYLSPHLDDAVLSCGGLIYQQRALQPLVITLFAGVPDYGVLSPFAAGQHRRWGEPADPIGDRRREDAAALAALGARCEHWDYLDCIYRRALASGEFLYASEEALWGEVARADGVLVDGLVARLQQEIAPRKRSPAMTMGATTEAMTVQICAPLAVGQHVDHQLVLRVALRLRQKGWAVQFYEDYPYAEDPHKLARALQSWASPPEATVVCLSEEDLAAKTAAIRCYASQLDVLFGDESAVAGRVQAYALAVGGGAGYGERYWRSRQQKTDSNPAQNTEALSRAG